MVSYTDTKALDDLGCKTSKHVLDVVTGPVARLLPSGFRANAVSRDVHRESTGCVKEVLAIGLLH